MEKPAPQVSSVRNKTNASAIQNRIADNMSPCFTPFFIFTKRLMSVLIVASEHHKQFKRLMYLILMDDLFKISQSFPSLMLSKALVKSISYVYG